MSKEPDCYVFRKISKNQVGYIAVSRHKKPDFVYGMSDKEIEENWEIYPVYFKEVKKWK